MSIVSLHAGVKSDNLSPQLVNNNRVRSIIHLEMHPKEMAIRELLDHCLGTDDPDGWNEFVHRIEPTIAGVVFKTLDRFCLPQLDVVQDLVQQTYIKIFADEKRVLRGFQWQHDDAIYAFLKVVARRIVIDYSRKLNPIVPLDEVMNTAVDDRYSEEARLRIIRIDELVRYLEAIAAPSRDKEIFLLYFHYGHTAKEIGQLPGINLPEKKVEIIVSRLIRQVKAQIKRRKDTSI